MTSGWLRKAAELWIPNSSALILSSAPSVFTVGFEYAILGLSAEQIFKFRVMYNIAKYTLSPLAGVITDRVRRRFPGGRSGFISKSVRDGLALSLYQIPLYTASATVFGVGLSQIAIMWAWFGMSDFLIGRFLYGAVLDWVRARFKQEHTAVASRS